MCWVQSLLIMQADLKVLEGAKGAANWRMSAESQAGEGSGDIG